MPIHGFELATTEYTNPDRWQITPDRPEECPTGFERKDFEAAVMYFLDGNDATIVAYGGYPKALENRASDLAFDHLGDRLHAKALEMDVEFDHAKLGITPVETPPVSEGQRSAVFSEPLVFYWDRTDRTEDLMAALQTNPGLHYRIVAAALGSLTKGNAVKYESVIRQVARHVEPELGRELLLSLREKLPVAARRLALVALEEVNLDLVGVA